MGGASPPSTVRVPPERLTRWLDGFAERHGTVEHRATSDEVVVAAADGAVATCEVPFPPLRSRPDLPYAGLVEHAVEERRVGVLLVRRGGFAVGVFAGARLLSSKVGSRHVQGRSKAGGSSQQRFARRREEQARVAFNAAADAAAAVLLPAAAELRTLVCGGDRKAIDAVLADRRLEPLRPLAERKLYPVPDPRRRVLDTMPAKFRAVTITVTEPSVER